jgi:LacI family transcriptional regulator
MSEVAKRANVAISSVSRVISGHPDVSPAMRERVLAAIDELDYAPDFLAQSLRRGQTMTAGFVVADITNPLMATITFGAESTLRGAGYSMLLMDSEVDPNLDADHIRYLGRRVDGMILSLASERRRETLEALASVDVPIVLVDREVPSVPGTSSVCNDHRSGTRAATEHLLDLGHRRIAMITGTEDLWPLRERMGGMLDAVTGRGLRNETMIMMGAMAAEPNHGETSTEGLLRLQPRPTAIIAAGNQAMFAGVLRALLRNGVSFPGDISLVTCDDVPLAELYSPPISVVRRDLRALGRVAAELLVARLSGSSEPERVVLPTTYVPRASVGPVPAS